MNILIAPDSFKGSLSAVAVAENLKKGICETNEKVNVQIHPMADGGEGTLEVLDAALQADKVKMFVKNALFKTIAAEYLRLGDTAYIEMARASGFEGLSPAQRNPEFTTSYGTGQFIKHAVKNGCRKVYLFVGGTATNDAAMGIAQALGYTFFDAQGNELFSIGESLQQLHKIVRPTSPLEFELYVVSDVKNPLYGPNGAACVYARQKGADHDMVERLDKGLQNFADVVKREFKVDLGNLEGGGAAGGTPAGCSFFFNAHILPGVQTIIKLTKLMAEVEKTDVLISGEGSLDKQTLSGKVVNGLSQLAQKLEKPFYVVCGQNKLAALEFASLNVEQVYTIMDRAGSVEKAIENAGAFLFEIGQEIGRGLNKPVK